METKVNNEETIRKVTMANEQFATDLYMQLKKKGADDANILFSPFSVSAVLSMAAAGSGGNTERQMTAGLHLPDMATVASGYKQHSP